MGGVVYVVTPRGKLMDRVAIGLAAQIPATPRVVVQGLVLQLVLRSGQILPVCAEGKADCGLSLWHGVPMPPSSL